MAREGSLNRWLDEHEGADRMQFDIGGVRACPPAAKPAQAGGVPIRPRRRRRPEIGQEMATPLAATFLSLLLVQNFLPAHAAGSNQADPAGAQPNGPEVGDGPGGLGNPTKASLPAHGL